jgi:hypothetical protein
MNDGISLVERVSALDGFRVLEVNEGPDVGAAARCTRGQP